MKDKLLNSLIGRTISILLMVILIFCSIRTDVFAMEKDASVEQVTGERGIERELTIQGEEVYEGRGFRIISGVLDNWEIITRVQSTDVLKIIFLYMPSML